MRSYTVFGIATKSASNDWLATLTFSTHPAAGAESSFL